MVDDAAEVIFATSLLEAEVERTAAVGTIDTLSARIGALTAELAACRAEREQIERAHRAECDRLRAECLAAEAECETERKRANVAEAALASKPTRGDAGALMALRESLAAVERRLSAIEAEEAADETEVEAPPPSYELKLQRDGADRLMSVRVVPVLQ